MKLNKDNTAQPAELPDDVDIELGPNYELPDPCKPINPQPGYRYFAAIKDSDNTRPDSVLACKAMGYEVCTEEKIASTECTLMRMPADKWERMNRAKLQRANRAARIESGSIQGVPDEFVVKQAGHNQGK